MHRTVFERQAPPASAIDHALAGSRHEVFWLDDVERPAHPRLDGEIEADLVVVGGGYTGLWTALLAKERNLGLRVVVLEAQRVGWAASGRNGGFVEASLTHGDENGRRRWPEEMPLLDALGARNLDEIEATITRYGMQVDAQRTGTLSVAVEPHQVEWLRDEPVDDDHVFLDQDAVRAQVGSPTYLAGSWDRRGTLLAHPAKLALELARVAVELGVEIYEHSPATAVDDDPSGPADAGVRVRTKHGAVRAEQAVLATNVFPSLLKRNRLMTVPVYDYVIATEPLTAEQLAAIGWTNRQGLADLANQFHYYRMTADDRIVFGGYDAVYHYGGRVRAAYEDRASSYRMLTSHLLTTFPQLEGIRVTHRWAGAIDTSTRFCAFYGTARSGRVAYAAGFTGLGVAATRFAAQVMLDQLDGADTERTRLRMVRERPVPFPPEPAASMGINATRWSLDRADHSEGRRNLLLRGLDALGLGFDS
ncbi:FAD-binding oxidoreductase [Schumannella sp. 10F1B-5-1]|uniref:NAD(P)/FAD-dependent oxidoreductase n=1 Tax=Schumannella sp. 10F1B-5-1 TaxID=2590780 RepID=UPI00113197DD|nr:FAD-dependent oxidoreductase [Schumannella sp. 10F1B-5-1]TPW73482.1 FAD-dependent oxidoreductase [Schumannella sp. 10F1B-5-1]